jgi:hypothetical protein
VPVKRVDQLKLGFPSHRFANREPVMSSFSDEEVKKAPPPPTMGAGGAGDPTMGLPAGIGGLDPTVATPNGLTRKRYVERTDQVRRMAVAVTLIVDQGHIQDVIRALSNSRLRFQNTQIHYDRFRGTINLGNPELMAGGTMPGDPAAGIGLRLPEAGIRRGGGGRANDVVSDEEKGQVGRGGRFGAPMGAGGVGAPSAEDETYSNLVELTVYGLISLYEQFPPKAATDAAGQPAIPGDQAPVAGAAPVAAPVVPGAGPAVPAPAGLPKPP